MNRVPKIALLATICLWIAGCGGEHFAGNSVETENSLAARELKVDSILPSWNHPTTSATLATLRFDTSNFDFTKVSANARGLGLQRLDDSALSFEVVAWDSAAGRGRVRVRLDTNLLKAAAKIRLRWNLGPAGPVSNPAKTWLGISDSQRLAINSVLVDDFEDGDSTTLLLSGSRWRLAAVGKGSASGPYFDAAGAGRKGLGLRTGFYAASPDYAVLATSLGSLPRSLRTMDSLVFMLRGNGKVDVALEHLKSGAGPKAWTHLTMDTAWTRIRIQPKDFDAAGAPGNILNNYGWNAVRDSVTDLTFILHDGTEAHIDDIRIYGVDRDDLR